VQAAFDVLNNPEKRELYDRYGSSFETMGAGGPRGAHPWTWSPGAGAGPGGFGAEDFDFGQFFADRFGDEAGGGGMGGVFEQFRRAAGGKKRAAGRDLEHEILVPFQVAVQGGEVQVQVTHPTGASETLAVKVPAGIEEGKKIRLRGQGQPGPRGGPAGDLLLVVRIAPHPFFQRLGNNLLLRLPLTLGEAAAGAKVDVPTPHGVVALSVPPCTSSGAKLRVKGQGVVPKSGPPGDLLVEVQVVVPKGLSYADKEALRQLDRRYVQDPRSSLRW
jgi:DnaJ-class molecular chaperone